MTVHDLFRLSGSATPTKARAILDEVCDHFVEHAEVRRDGDTAVLVNALGSARLQLIDGRIDIELACQTQAALDLSRNVLAEHMFYFAGSDALGLVWRQPPAPGTVANLHEVTVISAHAVTRNMRRVVFSCADVTPFLTGDIHVRLLIPPLGREPVWPGYRDDGRLDWPEGEDALIPRAYTIRSVDAAEGTLAIDFLQHTACDTPTPGADFARDARPGQRAALLGPGSGGIPHAPSILLIGDESALPAMARIVEEAPEGTQLTAIIEVEDAAEEAYLPGRPGLRVDWLHRGSDSSAASHSRLIETARPAIENAGPDTFIFIACEKQDVRSLRTILKRRGHDRSCVYAAWYWER
ncbi:DUF2218 domain-containing protein [Aureimonas frigidaquae]|uniref:Siderophore-interacting protein n=1 Tax=Aureimonas frigidaquae TaxID=424757 RepID=A0A0P0Z3U7_9HYPH|nr:DUF2218 domain-containing protein [Aureimonas frigidaquae]BAT28804.1 siderophore-interacting protein [Aureimonas frigidaquae]